MVEKTTKHNYYTPKGNAWSWFLRKINYRKERESGGRYCKVKPPGGVRDAPKAPRRKKLTDMYLGIHSCICKNYNQWQDQRSKNGYYGGSICVGYPYSLLDWVPEMQSSWSLSVNVQRIPSNESAKSVDVERVKALNEARQSYKETLDIIAGDGKYGNAGFLRPLQDQRCGIVVRLRKDRVLYRTPEEPIDRKWGILEFMEIVSLSKNQNPGVIHMR